MRVVVCGEALIDLMPAPGSASPQAGGATSWLARCGGGPFNTAVALARLGRVTSFLGRFGDDGFATQLRDCLNGSGVDLSLAVASSQPTSLAVASVLADGQAAYTFHLRDTANFGWQGGDFPVLDSGDWLHFGSLASVVDPGWRALLDWLPSCACALSYDVNARPGVLPHPGEYWRRVEPFLAIVGASGGIVRASDEDLAFLARRVGDTGFDPATVATEWAATYGISLVVVTLGNHGAAAFTRQGCVGQVGGFPVTVVDTVAAGDTFTAGFLASWLDNRFDVTKALRQGNAAAALTCSRAGANPPTAAELDLFLAGHA